MEIKKNVPLKNYSTFKIGGSAKEFVVVRSENELCEALEYALSNEKKYFIMGGGSNLVFADSGFDGVAIKLEENRQSPPEIAGNILKCWAGERLFGVICAARDNDLGGWEELAGIPGTIGGAVRGNAGAYGSIIGDLIKELKIIEISGNKLEQKRLEKNECHFGYRHSQIKENLNWIISGITLELMPKKKEEIDRSIRETVKKRYREKPRGWKGTAGSFFKNPTVADGRMIKRFETDSGSTSKDDRIPARWLIGEVGMVGKKVGGISTDKINANFIVNDGTGTAEQIVMIASLIKYKVRDELGIELQEEVQYVGF